MWLGRKLTGVLASVAVLTLLAAFFWAPIGEQLGVVERAERHFWVDTDEAASLQLTSITDALIYSLDENGVKIQNWEVRPDAVRLDLHPDHEMGGALTSVWQFVNSPPICSCEQPAFEVGAESSTIVFHPKPEWRTKMAADNVTQTIAALRSRILKAGFADPEIEKSGEHHIKVRVFTTDQERLWRTVSDANVLNFFLVDDSLETLDLTSSDARPSLRGRHVRSVETQYSEQWDSWTIAFEFDPLGEIILQQVTEDNVGKRIALVVDKKVLIAPLIRFALSDGHMMIESGYTKQRADDIAKSVRRIALPAPLKSVEH